MTITHDQLLDGIETSLFLFPEIPHHVAHLPFPHVHGRVTPLSHPLLNLVGAAVLDDANADGVIREICDFYVEQNKAFGWITGPRSMPADLNKRLMRVGLTKVDELAGMVLTDLSTPIASNPDVQVRQVTPAELCARSDMMGRAYGLPPDVAAFLCEMVVHAGDALKLRAYLAYVNEQPVAFSNLVHLPDSPIVLLGGAATLPEHRAHGIYSSMVARRLADARNDGAQAAIIQAVRTTSAPICAKLGFQEISALEMYAWLPAGTSVEHS